MGFEHAATSFVIHECKRRVGDYTEIIINLQPLCGGGGRFLCAEEFAQTVYSRVKDSEDFLFILADVDPSPYVLDREGRKPVDVEELKNKYGVVVGVEGGAYDIVRCKGKVLNLFVYDEYDNVFILFKHK